MTLWDKIRTKQPLTKKDVEMPLINDEALKEIFAPSFTDLLKIKYSVGNGVFLFRDNQSLGGIVKIQPISLEAATTESKEEIFSKVNHALKTAIPTEYDNVWISQMFVAKKQNPKIVLNQIKQHCKVDNDFTKNWLNEVSEHLKDISNPNGAFIDVNTGNPWSLSQLDIYLCFYQEYKNEDKRSLEDKFKDTNEVLERLESAFQQATIGVSRVDNKEYADFLSSFLHNGTINYPNTSILNILDNDVSEIAVNKSKIKCNDGVFCFENQKHTQKRHNAYLPLEKITGDFNLGHLTAEQEDKMSILDKLQIGSIWQQTIIHLHKDAVLEILEKISNQSMGTNSDSEKNKETVILAQEKIAAGDNVYRLATGIYLSTNKIDQLDSMIRKVKSILGARGLEILSLSENPLAQEDFINFLPFNFSYKNDQKWYQKRTSLEYLSDITKLSPLYGRSQGTGSAALLKFNRGGEPLFFDPLADREKNAFGLIFGPMGSGKSAFLVDFLLQMIAVYNPRVFIIEKGDSFGLLLEHCKSLGLTTHRVAVKASSKDITLPPFADATKLITDKDNLDSDRDLLGEMLIIARLMITGGEKNEEKKFGREDSDTLSSAIKLAAQKTLDDKRKITLTEDVIFAIEELSKDNNLNPNEKERIRKMAKAMKVFIASDFDKKLFNTEGKLFPEVDITQLDVGILGNEGYQDKLAVAFIALMNNINTLAEAKQFEDRPTLILVDEAHLITTNPLLAPYVVKIAKMWRKLGAWLWLATQSLEDYTDKSKQMLSVMEWWICLSMGKQEVKEVSKFKNLTAEQEALLVSATKSKRQYTEGVVLSDRIEALFRNVPPSLSLALAMTEKDEKAQRMAIMKDKNCTELEAVYFISQEISKSRRSNAA